MDIVTTKVLVAGLFGLIRFVFGVLPIFLCMCLKVSRNENGKRTVNEIKRKRLDCCVALVQSFGGGVLFATCFLHMIPEVYFSVEELRNHDMLKADYPYSQLLVSLGFFLIYVIEEISQWLLSKMPKKPCKENKRSTTTAPIITKDNKIVPELKQSEKNNVCISNNSSINEEVQTDNLTKLNNVSTELELSPEINAELEEIIEDLKTQQQILRCIFIVLALSFHAIFEGLAIGLQHSTANIWYLFTAVSIHSATILFCIGLEIFLAGTSTRTILIHMFLLAVTSPLGVIVGLTISLTMEMHTNVKSFAVVLLEGLSAGTILFITFFEVLNREKERRNYILKRFICLCIGFIMMALLECIKVE
ncbi:hypothetical protein RN001_001750 [Aquatica leii]|uniref:Zinc transporter ZIP3 n=1 Tax=Aquatica leii TaxID=1421715 RepID=A0AAN7SLH2_9COLE|nr:hypothetical protein RN001_001750 [Aquatica leii]